MTVLFFITLIFYSPSTGITETLGTMFEKEVINQKLCENEAALYNETATVIFMSNGNMLIQRAKCEVQL